MTSTSRLQVKGALSEDIIDELFYLTEDLRPEDLFSEVLVSEGNLIVPITHDRILEITGLSQEKVNTLRIGIIDDQDISYLDMDTYYIPLGSVEISNLDTDNTTSYPAGTLLYISEETNLAFRTDSPAYLLSFYYLPGLIEKLPIELTTEIGKYLSTTDLNNMLTASSQVKVAPSEQEDALRRCGIYNRGIESWDAFIKRGSPNVFCYEYLLNKLNPSQQVNLIADSHAIGFSSYYGNLDVVLYLSDKVETHPDVNNIYYRGILGAVVSGQLDILKYLLSQLLPRLNHEKDRILRTLGVEAIHHNQGGIWEYLIKHPDITDNTMLSLYDMAKEEGSLEMVSFFYHKYVGYLPKRSLLNMGPAIIGGNVDIIKFLRSKGGIITTEDLYAAVASKSVSMVEYIYTATFPSKPSKPELHKVLVKSFVKSIELDAYDISNYLITQVKTELMRYPRELLPAIQHVISQAGPEQISMLENMGLSFKIRDSNRAVNTIRSAINSAVSGKNYDNLYYLLDKYPKEYLEMILMSALRYGDMTLIEDLSRRGVTVEDFPKQLESRIVNYHLDYIQYLDSLGLFTKNMIQDMMLWAVRNNDLPALDYAISKGGSVNSAYRLAYWHTRDRDIFSYLLGKGVDADIVSNLPPLGLLD